MRLLLAGTRSFGVAAYDAILADGHDIAAVWAPAGDKLWRHAQRGKTRTQENFPAGEIAGLRADLIVCAHSHDFVSKKARHATELGGIGYHPSLLPRHRGRDAVKWTIAMGDPIAGGSVYWLTDNVDGGPIAAQQHVFVPPRRSQAVTIDDHASQLWRQQLFPLGIRLLTKTLRDLDGGTIVEIPQDEACATWEPSWTRPPLFRPELTQIGAVNGYTHVTTAT